MNFKLIKGDDHSTLINLSDISMKIIINDDDNNINNSKDNNNKSKIKIIIINVIPIKNINVPLLFKQFFTNNSPFYYKTIKKLNIF